MLNGARPCLAGMAVLDQFSIKAKTTNICTSRPNPEHNGMSSPKKHVSKQILNKSRSNRPDRPVWRNVWPLRRHLAIPAHPRRTLTTFCALPQLGSISGRTLVKHWASRGRASSSVGEHRPTRGRALGERWASTVEQWLDGVWTAGSNRNTPIMPNCSTLSGNAEETTHISAQVFHKSGNHNEITVRTHGVSRTLKKLLIPGAPARA